MPRIYRIRYIPSETVDLSSDKLLYRDEQYLVTEWRPIKPREDIASGISCVFLDKGWKISAMMDRDSRIKYLYCDIIDIVYEKASDTYSLLDLLTDIMIFNDGRVEVIDLDELAIAFEEKLITENQLCLSLRRSNNLLKAIYSSDYPTYFFGILQEKTGWECKTWYPI